jgi:hypothetical protein
VQQVLRHRVHHGTRHLGASRSVEVGDRALVMAALERGKAGSDVVDRSDRRGLRSGE